jgi:hypothetical protein
LQTALWLLDEGLWPIPIRPGSKRPIGRKWGVAKPDHRALVACYEKHQWEHPGVAIALGPQSGVVDIEFDGPGADLELPDTLGWTSARGLHRVYAWDRRLEGLLTTAVIHLGGCELRAGGHGKQLCSVCPPSIGTDGQRRSWFGPWEIAPLPEALLHELELIKPHKTMSYGSSNGTVQRIGPETHPGPRNRRRLDSNSRYGAAALHYEAQAVAGAQPGTRNNTLFRAALSLGQLVAAGLLSRAIVEAELAEAALSVGLGAREIEATIKSGIEAGFQHPREVRR